LLVIGMTWLFLGIVVLQLNLTSARAIALAAGLLPDPRRFLGRWCCRHGRPHCWRYGPVWLALSKGVTEISLAFGLRSWAAIRRSAVPGTSVLTHHPFRVVWPG
jgi:hypothetical protein